MKYYFQLHTGDAGSPAKIDLPYILSILEDFHKAGRLAGVLAGWGEDLAPYRALSEQLREWGLPLYFKTAVFAELEGLAASFEPMIDASLSPSSPYHLNEEEHFLFRCPASDANRQIALAYAKSFLDTGLFDGLFLDRIRYNSLISGIEGQGCFCRRCLKRYQEKGIDTDRLRSLLIESAKTRRPFAAAYQDGVYHFEDPDIDAFFREKSRLITENVALFASYAHERGLALGLDLFTPSAAYLTGQDTLALSSMADFIKPMLYQFTNAPAGIPFEMPFVQAFLQDGSEPLAAPSSIFEKDLAFLRKVPCHVFPGIEVNRIDPICLPSEAELKSTLAALQASGIETAVASWDIQKMPASHLSLLKSGV